MKVIGIIPSRYASERFPGKPLAMIGGKSVLQRTYEQAAKALDEVIVAAGDGYIINEVLRFGGIVATTSDKHICGTDRCLEVFNLDEFKDTTFINIQGDQPFIDPEHIKLIERMLHYFASGTMLTLITDLDDEDRDNPNVVKVTLNASNVATNFSRTYIDGFTNFRHMGVYGFGITCIELIPKMDISENEKREHLEQLRWLDNGMRIKCLHVDHGCNSIDSLDDLINAEATAVFQSEADALQSIPRNPYNNIIDAIALNVHTYGGKLITSGMGKAGQVAHDIATTFSSTGTPAVFLHPADAQHGDLGIVQPYDIFLIVSNSGETRELIELMDLVNKLHPRIRFIVMTGNRESTLSRRATFRLLTGNPPEVCPLGMTPTTSTTVMSAIGDALVVLMMKRIGFTRDDYALRHHGGYLGVKLKTATPPLTDTPE